MVALLDQIALHFGQSSATGVLAIDIKVFGSELLSTGKFTGSQCFLLANPLFYDSHNARGIELRRKYRRVRRDMNYILTC